MTGLEIWGVDFWRANFEVLRVLWGTRGCDRRVVSRVHVAIYGSVLGLIYIPMLSPSLNFVSFHFSSLQLTLYSFTAEQ